MEKKEMAKEYFSQGSSCAQAILQTYRTELNMSEEDALKLGSSFGGGLAGMREVCGAFSGASMVIGMLFGYTDVSDNTAKRNHYLLIQSMATKFKEKNESIICRDLLKRASIVRGAVPENRTEKYYKERPCTNYICDICDIIDEIIIKMKEN